MRKCSEAHFSIFLSFLVCYNVKSILCYMFLLMCPYFGVASDCFVEFLNLYLLVDSFAFCFNYHNVLKFSLYFSVLQLMF